MNRFFGVKVALIFFFDQEIDSMRWDWMDWDLLKWLGVIRLNAFPFTNHLEAFHKPRAAIGILRPGGAFFMCCSWEIWETHL